LHKKLILILAVGIVALVATSLVIWSLTTPQVHPRYEKSILRNFGNHEEETALTTAESINYSAISSYERFDGSSEPEAYLHPSTYLAYTYANFIDSEVINYYQARYDNQQGKEYPRHIELNYRANVTKYTDFRIYNSPAPQGVNWHNTTMVMSALNGSVVSRSDAMQIFYKNQSGYQMTEWEYDFNFTDCYFVEMNLAYSETYASTAAFFSEVHQIVVLDRDFSPVLVGVESGKAVA